MTKFKPGYIYGNGIAASKRIPSQAVFAPDTTTQSVLFASLRIIFPLAAALLLSACASSGVELSGLSSHNQAWTSTSGQEPSGEITTGSLSSIDANRSFHGSDAIVKARNMRQSGDLQSALNLLDAAAKDDADNIDLLRERGLLALELGQIDKAKTLLAQADKAGPADWRIKSALGSAHAASGDQKAAQRQFSAALKLAPDHPSILNNLALSYALDGQHARAERLLRTAANSKSAAPEAKQNLALLLGLNGNINEARRVSETALPKHTASANMSYLEQLKTASSQISRVSGSRAHAHATTTTLGSN